MAGVVTLLARLTQPWRVATYIGLAFAIGHFHGREKRDYEIHVHSLPPQLDDYLMWRWTWDNVTDFWPVALVLLAIMLLLRFRTR